MHLHFEQNISSRTDCTIHSLSWMGKVPDTLPDDNNGGWKLNRYQYYSEGWLASGNAKGIVGVTFTTSHCKKYDPPNRSNFNLRGHRTEVILVRWNEPYQKLATCDSQGIIFVWIKHEGRWSIELINDRNSQVTDFAWSHDGHMALICYCDGFVLVGSVAGQRYWSSMLNLDATSIKCGVWTPDDQKVLFGTTDGQIVVMSSTGAMVAQFTVVDGMEITNMIWSCEKFKMDESEANKESGVKVAAEYGQSPSPEEKNHILAVCFKHGAIYLMNNYDDPCPRVIHTLLTGLRLDWSNCGEYLAVGGFTRLPNLQCRNEIHFYSKTGQLKHWAAVPSQGKPLTAICWGHNDRRLFIAAGHNLYVTWVHKAVPSLQKLCQWAVKRTLRLERNAQVLPLPAKLRQGVQALFSPTIKSYIPDPFKLREFVSTPPPGCERLFCTMVRHGEETSGGHYTLYLEYLGGLIPLLKGKRASKLRPDFAIFDPKIKAKGRRDSDVDVKSYDHVLSSNSDSDSDVSTDGCGSPRVQRKRRQKTFRADKVERSTTFRTLNDLLYDDNLPESSKLLEVTSNIWGTKFKLVGTASHLPEDLGNVLYKTSLLHLQPRQMTVTVTEMPREFLHLAQDSNFTPAGGGMEDNDDMACLEYHVNGTADPKLAQRLKLRMDLANQINSETISVDILTNHCELLDRKDSSETGSVTNSVNTHSDHSERSSKGVVMKTKLSPAESHPQNNNAFNAGYNPVLKDSYLRQGARPKVPLFQAAIPCSNQSMDNSGLSVITNHVNNCGENESNYDSGYSNTSMPFSNTTDMNVQKVSSIQQQGAQDSVRSSHSKSNRTSMEINLKKHTPSLVDTLIRTDVQDNIPRWADPAVQGIKYIDDEESAANREVSYENNTVCDSSQTAVTPVDSQKRLYLAHQSSQDLDSQEQSQSHDQSHDSRGSIDSSATFEDESDFENGDSLRPGDIGTEGADSSMRSLDSDLHVVNDDELVVDRNVKKVSKYDMSYSASLPASPVRRLHQPDSPTKRIREEVIKGKCKHHSPLFKRKSKYHNSIDSSDDDLMPSIEEIRINYKGLESFQKAQFKQKLKRARNKGDERSGKSRTVRRQFVMHNKAPLWNENSQVYQLDFGGRVTQESAKNFQMEFRGKQVMQFGRIDSNAYTLDFQYPFTAIQAFGVALANVTQRLK